MCQAIQIIKIISFLSLLLISGIAKAVIISTEYNGEEKSKLLAESKAAEAICSLEVIYRLKTVRGTCVYIDLGQGSASSKSVGIILTSAHLLDVAGEAPIVIQVKFSSSSEMNTIDEFSIHPLHQVIERKGHIAILKMEVPENFGIQGMKLGFSSDDLQKESLLMGSFGGRIALNLPNQEWIEKLEKRVVHVYPTLILKKK